ncbi:MAG: UbiD family decarboxylase [Pseudomonadota bacterium]|nr:UbiD family decarboxylase [Pseudomonadota bacterium]
MHDLRSFAAHLEKKGELIRVKKTVNRKFELPALMRQLEKQRKAYIFESIEGADVPLIGGILNSPMRMSQSIGKEVSDDYAHHNHAAIFSKAFNNPLAHVITDNSPVKDVIIKGDAIDLHKLPVPTFFELDSGPFITGAVGISIDPDHEQLNMGFYRGLVVSDQHIVINASSMSDLRRIYAAAEKADKPMPIALALGVPPALLMTASGKAPPGVSEIDIAGSLMGKPIELIKCETNDLMVPANAEIIIEGIVDPHDKIWNTLGEFADQYGPEIAPKTRVTAITRRKDAMFYSIMAGRNPEHNTIGAVSTYGMQRVIEDNLRAQFPNIKDINVASAPQLGTMLHIFISINKKNDDEPQKLLDAAFAATAGIFPVSTITKRIVIVDDDVDVFSLEEVEWAIWTRLSKQSKMLIIPDVKSWELERCADDEMRSMRVGIDATMDIESVDKLIKPLIPGASDIQLKDYL